jgi:signal transduction histidine kinase
VTLGLKTENISGQRSAVISVADTGLGIDKDQYEKIFDRYYQIPGRQQAQGNGIGLSLVKNLGRSIMEP